MTLPKLLHALFLTLSVCSLLSEASFKFQFDYHNLQRALAAQMVGKLNLKSFSFFNGLEKGQ